MSQTAQQAAEVDAAEVDPVATGTESSESAAAGEATTAASLAAALPPYTRSLFRVAVPVSVHLARKRESVREIVEMAPGSILTFDKGCDQLLELAIGDRVVAEGEAVKVGDKFGFRVVKIVSPEEQFKVVEAEAHAQARAGRTPTIVNLAGS